MSAKKKMIVGVGALLLILLVVGGFTLYATNGLNNEMGTQLRTLFQTSTRLTNTYDNPKSRYSIKYPVDWEYDESKLGTVVFSGREGSPSFYSTVNVQVILTKKLHGEYSTVTDFMNDIKNQVKTQSPKSSILESGPYEMKDKNGVIMKGEYMIFTYDYSGISVQQWQIVILRPDGQVFYAWGYTAPVDRYEADLPIAKDMLTTWVIY